MRPRLPPRENRPLLTACDSNPAVFAANFDREILKSSSLKFSCFREKRRLGGEMGVNELHLDFKTSCHDLRGRAGRRAILAWNSRA